MTVQNKSKQCTVKSNVTTLLSSRRGGVLTNGKEPGYLNWWPRWRVIQHMGTNVEDLQKVGKQLLDHCHERTIRQGCPGFLHFMGAPTSVSAATAAVVFPSPGIPQAFGSYGWNHENNDNHVYRHISLAEH